MKLKYKAYRLKKTEDYIKNNKFLLLFNSINKTPTKENNISSSSQRNVVYSVSNSIMKKVLKPTIYRNLTLVINGPIVLVIFKFKEGNNDFSLFKKLILSKNSSMFLGLKLNKKFYSQPQLLSLGSLNYLENIKVLHSSLNNSLGLFFNRCKINSK